MVPVLSSTTTSIAPDRSRLSLDLTRMPISAPLPVPTITAVGVARPMAQGQAMTRTATMLIKALVKTVTSEPGGTGTRKNQTRKVTREMAITTGTKTAEILSARFWMGALLAWADSTSLMIWESAVSLPIFVASNLMKPSLLIVAP